jgi:DNA-binding CsgD family transcriptional regulator
MVSPGGDAALGRGQPAEAGPLFAEAGRRALAQGAAGSAVALLDRARGLLADADAGTRAGVLESLLYALAEAGLVERALASANLLDELGGGLDPRRRAHLHTRLAWAAAVTGRYADGQAQVELARALLGPDAAPPDTAQVDVVAAHLALDLPGPHQLRTAEELARRAATIAEATPLPVVACQAWQLLGALTRPRDPDETTACLERARSIAVRHDLTIWEIHALVRLGNDDALRDGGLERLEQARRLASRAGAVIARYQAEASLALQAILRGEFDTATALIDQILAATTRLKLVETTQYVLLLRAVQAGHRGRRRQMRQALAEFRHWGGDQAQHAPRVHGLAGTFCALLEEDRHRALEESTRALRAEEANPTIFHLAGRYGLDLLLRALDGAADWSAYRSVTANPASRMRWDRQFAAFARAVLAGRAGRSEEATAAVAEALRLGEPFPTGRHLGLRLVSEAVLADGWGRPVEWLRTAEDHFHSLEVTAVAGACRALLRRAGVTAVQRRAGVAQIPAELRSAGVTAREYEVLQLLGGRLSNREIADRLHLSPRTVEKHVASLMAKTGQPDRIALAALAPTGTLA